jgi:hypothetical protein
MLIKAEENYTVIVITITTILFISFELRFHKELISS